MEMNADEEESGREWLVFALLSLMLLWLVPVLTWSRCGPHAVVAASSVVSYLTCLGPGIRVSLIPHLALSHIVPADSRASSMLVVTVNTCAGQEQTTIASRGDFRSNIDIDGRPPLSSHCLSLNKQLHDHVTSLYLGLNHNLQRPQSDRVNLGLTRFKSQHRFKTLMPVDAIWLTQSGIVHH